MLKKLYFDFVISLLRTINNKEKDTFARTFYLELFIIRHTANNLDMPITIWYLHVK